MRKVAGSKSAGCWYSYPDCNNECESNYHMVNAASLISISRDSLVPRRRSKGKVFPDQRLGTTLIKAQL